MSNSGTIPWPIKMLIMSFITGSKVSIHCFRRSELGMESSEQDLFGDLLIIFFISSVVQCRKILSTLLSPVL